MKNLEIINSKTLEHITNKRAGETKFFEQTQYLSNLIDFPSMLADSGVKFVLFGIKEDIGILANNGQPGAKNTWDIALKSLLNLQSNQFTTPSNVFFVEYFSVYIIFQAFPLVNLAPLPLLCNNSLLFRLFV